MILVHELQSKDHGSELTVAMLVPYSSVASLLFCFPHQVATSDLEHKLQNDEVAEEVCLF